MHDDEPLVVFDGTCGFCRAAVAYLQRRLALAGDCRPWQGLDLDSMGLTETDTRQSMWYVSTSRRESGPMAFAAWFATGNRTARLFGRFLSLPGVRHLAQAVYWLVARNRHRIPGPWEHACTI
jgi:predicted DCC family thiol-disulfide oxidoreductase YuxK